MWCGPFVSVIVAGLVGCEANGLRRLNSPPQGAEPASSETMPELVTKSAFVYMGDNAMLSDMTISDIHFVPHTTELNGLGAKRLERYATLLEHYGGMLHYDTKIEDEDVTDKRLAHIREFLATAGLGADDITVERGISGGTGLPAAEAILIVKRTRTPDPSAGPGSKPGGGSNGKLGEVGGGTGGGSRR
jgi:hypothetical protein